MSFTGKTILQLTASSFAMVLCSGVCILSQNLPKEVTSKLIPPLYEKELHADTVYQAWVSHYASSLSPGRDVASAVAVDASKNVYVTGCISSPNGLDYLTVKYDSYGNVLWTARYNGPGNGDDCPDAIALDDSGNVYVTGNSFGYSLYPYYPDYATIKYNSSGVQLWVARYKDSINYQNFPEAITVDGSGNVYVTGSSLGDYTTIKYNPSGVEQWVARYNGPENSADWAADLAVDASNNVYVTGYSFSPGTSYDYATVKYNSSGVEQWVARYNGPGNYKDVPASLAVDASGNVYVTGYSVGSGTSDDYATIKYNSSGKKQWVARYNGSADSSDKATALVVDASGNVYVTGGSMEFGTSSDYTTIKYDSSGMEQWIDCYNGPADSSDWAGALAVDVSGNVYVAGGSFGFGTSYDYVTTKYNSIGVEQWAVRYNGPGNSSDYVSAIAVDGSGNSYVTGESFGSSTARDYATIKYDSSGIQQWATRYDGTPNSQDVPKAIAVDASGNVYETGRSFGSGTGEDYATIKYNATGDQQWVARYDGLGDSTDEATALAVDALGNVYVTGSSLVPHRFYYDPDYATVKYNAAGVQLWVVGYDAGNSNDNANAIAVDASGNVYVTGSSYDSRGVLAYATIKYNSSGTLQWVVRSNSPGYHDDATALAIDNSGNVYVTGRSVGSGTLEDYATIKYNATGVEQWVARYNGPGNSFDKASAIAVDDSGNVYVTGSSYGSGTSYDYATVKYNAAGVEQWVARYNGPENSDDDAVALGVYGTGNIYVTGRSYCSGTSTDYATIKYSAAGVQQWVTCYNGQGNFYDYPTALAADGTGNVYVTGSSYGSATLIDYATIKYNADGVEQWLTRYNGTGNYDDYATALAVDNSGNVYVTGSSVDSGRYIYTTIKYTQITVGVEDKSTNVPTHYSLAQNYPNPFNPSTTIRYSIPRQAVVTLKVYNLLGQEIATLVNEKQPAGEYVLPWNAGSIPTGVYFYRIQAGEFMETRKLVLLK